MVIQIGSQTLKDTNGKEHSTPIVVTSKKQYKARYGSKVAKDFVYVDQKYNGITIKVKNNKINELGHFMHS